MVGDPSVPPPHCLQAACSWHRGEDPGLRSGSTESRSLLPSLRGSSPGPREPLFVSAAPGHERSRVSVRRRRAPPVPLPRGSSPGRSRCAPGARPPLPGRRRRRRLRGLRAAGARRRLRGECGGSRGRGTGGLGAGGHRGGGRVPGTGTGLRSLRGRHRRRRALFGGPGTAGAPRSFAGVGSGQLGSPPTAPGAAPLPSRAAISFIARGVGLRRGQKSGSCSPRERR